MNTLYIVTGPDNELEIFNTKVDARQYVEDMASDGEEGPFVARECKPIDHATDIPSHLHGMPRWDTDHEFCSCVDGEFNDHEKNPPLWMRVQDLAPMWADLPQECEPIIDTTQPPKE